MPVLCGHVSVSGALKPAKLYCHLETKHPELKSKSIDYFERQSTVLKGQQKILKGYRFERNRPLVKALLLLALNITNAKKLFIMAEGLVMLCVVDACAKLSEESYAEAIKIFSFLMTLKIEQCLCHWVILINYLNNSKKVINQ
jgi:hypothetical protein